MRGETLGCIKILVYRRSRRITGSSDPRFTILLTQHCRSNKKKKETQLYTISEQTGFVDQQRPHPRINLHNDNKNIIKINKI